MKSYVVIVLIVVIVSNNRTIRQHWQHWNFATLKLWNPGTLELWNFGTLECVTIVLNPLRGRRFDLDCHIYCPSSPTGKERKAQSVKRKEIPFVTYLSALHSKLNFTLYALGYCLSQPVKSQITNQNSQFTNCGFWFNPYNSGTLKHWNYGTIVR